MDRRNFCLSAAAATLAASRTSALAALDPSAPANGPLITLSEIEVIDRERILRAANEYLPQPPITVTASSSPRSKGGKHDYFSEADYFWPDPKNPNGPYIRKDGERNPNRFMGNRSDLGDMSAAVLALGMGACFLADKRCAEHAAKVLSVWFVDAKTRMNPNLEFGQAVRGINTGRGTGVIDTVSLIHVTQGVSLLEQVRWLRTGSRNPWRGSAAATTWCPPKSNPTAVARGKRRAPIRWATPP